MLTLRFSSSNKNPFYILIILSCTFVYYISTAKDQVFPEAKNKFYLFKGQFLGIRGQEVMDTKAFNDNPPLTANNSRQAIFFHLAATFTLFLF